MRSFSAFYFFLRVLIFIIDYFSQIKRFLPGYWSIYTLLFLTLALLIALIRPYKKTYINVFDTIFLASFAVVCHLMHDFTVTLSYISYHQYRNCLNCSNTRTITCVSTLLEGSHKSIM